MANIKITNQIEALGLNYGKPSGLCLSKVPSAENTINLIVGLGGSGIDLLRETKGLINRICCADNNRRMAATRVLYLGIDTDGKDDGPLKSPWVCADGTAVKLDEGEAVELPNSSLLKFLVPAMHDANARKYPHIVEWLDYGIETAVKGGGNGACGVRQAGRLCLFLHLDKVLEALKKQLDKAKSGATITQYNIFLMSGISGGTGSGTFLDMAYILRDQVMKMTGATQEDVSVKGYLVMPDVNLENAEITKEYTKLNGYAALQDLDHLMNLKRRGGRFVQDYGFDVVVDTVLPPFDYVHTISREDAGGTVPKDYYKHVARVAAQNVLSFVASETQDPTNPNTKGSAEGAMEGTYNNVGQIERTCDKKFPERGYNYQAMGTAEFALPMDDVLKYVTSLLMKKMNALFDNDPTEDEAAEMMSKLGIDKEDYIANLIAGIAEPFPASQFNNAAVFGQNAEDLSAIYDKALNDADAVLKTRALQLKDDFAQTVKDVLTPKFEDVKYGPVWVNHLIVHHMLVELRRYRGEGVLEQNEAVSSKTQKAQQRSRLNSKGLHFHLFDPNKDAREYVNSYNEEFSSQLRATAAEYFTMDDGDDLCMVNYALNELNRCNHNWYNVVSEVLMGLQKVATTNDAGVVNVQRTKNHTTWGMVSVAEVSGFVESMFQLCDTDKLVKQFVKELLGLADVWSAGQVDVTAFLESYLMNNLKEITSASMEGYLDYLLVQNGQFANLNEALAGSDGIFDTLREKATPMLLFNKSDTPDKRIYVLSVPCDCPNIVAAAKAYSAAHNDTNILYSKVNSRICMQSMECAIPLFAYKPLAGYENNYYKAHVDKKRGTHLYVNENSRENGKLDWTSLPSPIPGRSRGNTVDGWPGAVKTQEERRSTLFDHLYSSTPAIRANQHGESADLDFRFFESRAWANCGVNEIIADSALQTLGSWDLKKVKDALKTLNGYKTNGLPRANSMVHEADGSAKPAETTILEECGKLANPNHVELSKRESETDPAKGRKIFEQACANIAREFFIASMPLCELGEKEKAKYEKLDAEIKRLEDIQEELERFPRDCAALLKMLVTDQVVENQDGLSYLYRSGSDLMANPPLQFENKSVREYQLFSMLQQWKAGTGAGGDHRKNLYEGLVKAANTAFAASSSNNSEASQIKRLYDRLAQLKTLCEKRERKHTEELSVAGNVTEAVYTGEGLRFYAEMVRSAKVLMEDLSEVMPEQAQQNNGGQPYGGNQPPYGGNQPPYGGNQPPYGGNQPPYGGNQPPYGGNQPPYGGNQPPYGGNQPPYGGNQPQQGYGQPQQGYGQPQQPQQPQQSAGWTCPNCGLPGLPEEALGCPRCGAPRG